MSGNYQTDFYLISNIDSGLLLSLFGCLAEAIRLYASLPIIYIPKFSL